MAFQGFIIFAGMRTGSNYLEASLNQAPGLSSYGEAFNPAFIGGPKRDQVCGVTMAARDADPGRFVQAMVSQTQGLPGFRYFEGHHRWVMDHLLADPNWAKIILSRPPIESYVSLQIAQATGYWRITDIRDRKPAKVVFQRDAYLVHAARITAFQDDLRRRLRRTGQTPFEIAYHEISDVDLLNGLLRFLGLTDRLSAPSSKLKRQNPGPLEAKVSNPEDMARVLAEEGGARTSPEPTQPAEPLLDLGPVYDGLRVAGEQLFVRLPGVPEGALPGYESADPLPFADLRPWLNRTKGHRACAAVSHPLARAMRLCRDVGLAPDPTTLLDGVLSGVIGDVAARPQADLLVALSKELIPDEILRCPDQDVPELDGLYDAALESLGRKAMNRDYRIFGYRKWRSG